MICLLLSVCFFFFQAEDGIRDIGVTGVQTCALPIFRRDPERPLTASRSRLTTIVTTVRPTSLAEGGAEDVHRVARDVRCDVPVDVAGDGDRRVAEDLGRSEEHTSELQSRQYLVCRLLLEKKKKIQETNHPQERAEDIDS